MTKLFLDILDNQRKAVFSQLSAITEKATLGGGTALALQIGHRRSYDFDLFFPDPIPPSLYRTIADTFNQLPIKRVDSTNQLTVQLSGGIEITCLYYWYPVQYPTIPTVSLPLVSLKDIATDKAFTIGKRNVWRDYVDFFYLLHDHHVTLHQIITDATRRFGNEFSAKLFLAQLTYTKDVADHTYSPIGTYHTDKEITEFLTKEVNLYLTKIMQ